MREVLNTAERIALAKRNCVVEAAQLPRHLDIKATLGIYYRQAREVHARPLMAGLDIAPPRQLRTTLHRPGS